MVSAEAVPGVLHTISRDEHGPLNYMFLNEAEQILAEGHIANPLYFRVEVSDPETGKLSSHTAYLDSAYKLIRIPYRKGMSLLKISFTDSLKKEHLLKLIPLHIKKS